MNNTCKFCTNTCVFIGFCVSVVQPNALLTLYRSGLGGVCKITDFVPVVPDSLRSHGLVLLSHSAALRSLPAHYTHGHTQIKRSLHSENHTHTVLVNQGLKNIIDAYRHFLRANTQYSHLPIQPAPTWKEMKHEQMSKHTDIKTHCLLNMSLVHYCCEGQKKKIDTKITGSTVGFFSAYLKQSSIFLALFMTEPEDHGSNILRLQRQHKV